MARRAFDVIDVVEILMHWYAGRSKSEVSRSLGVDRGTVRKYVGRAEVEGFVPGGPPLPREVWAAQVRLWFPELFAPELRSPTFPELARHHEGIKAGLETNTATTVWQRLRDEAGLSVGLSSFRRYCYLTLPEEVARSRVTVIKEDPPPGEEAQVDYGFLGRYFDTEAGRTIRVWAFVMVLACSRHLFVRPVTRMDQRTWVESHVLAFSFFGGATRRLVPDNLKAGVVKADLYDPKLNRAYAELAEHYGCLIDPARRQKPKDKPRVENPMAYVRDSLFAGREWHSLVELERAAVVWSREVAGRRSCRPLEGAAPITVFEAVEAEALLPLPEQPFELASWSTPKIGPDIHAKVGKTLYSVPWRFIGRHLDARESATQVQFFLDGELVKTHRWAERGKQTDFNDYPPEKVAFLMRTPAWCRKRAADVGPACAALVAELMAVNACYRLRSVQGVVGLVERHGAGRLEAACRRALEVGDPSYKTVKGILVAGTEADHDQAEATLTVVPAHLHGPQRLFDDAEGAAS
jgi:transposase